MFFKTDIPQQHASFHMEHFSLTKAYDWADRVSTHSWPFLPLIQVNGLPWKTISGELLTIRHLKNKTFWLLDVDASFGLLTKALLKGYVIRLTEHTVNTV